MKKLIYGALMCFSLFWLLGIAGSLECDKISLAQAIAWDVPVMILLYGSFCIGGFSK